MNEPIPLGLSFDDVLLVPQLSEIIPSETDVRTRLSAELPLNIPVLSSAMDTVTEAELAIALAREGGFGIIHRNVPVEKQAEMVAKVKRSENTVIENPFTVSPELSLADLLRIMEERGVAGFPVVNADGRLVGMVTTRDVWHVDNPKARVADVMTPRDKLVVGQPDTNWEQARAILYRHRIEKLPLVRSDDTLAGMITSQDIKKRAMFTEAAKDARGRLRVGAAIGVGGDGLARADAVIEAGADAIGIDAATGHTSRVVSMVGQLKSRHPEVTIIAGNVVTAQGARDLIAAGASAVKVGVGPGSICTTRVIAGVGVPQFSAIQNVASVCREHGVAVIADGGIRYSGDIVKALAAGADVVMLGSLLAGTMESPGNLVNHQGRTFKEYRGMGSLKAMRQGSGDRYGQNSSGKLVAEGVEGRVPYRGALREVLFQLVGGLRSGMGYLGAKTLEELRTKATFVRITPGGLKESHAHDIVITEEPVNYQSL
ncbi:MAG: IMP dehydrogenase [Verrucomicrobiales bacterium]|nr:IMP dehydrogenase [Verrucomicrobiales bacterium]